MSSGCPGVGDSKCDCRFPSSAIVLLLVAAVELPQLLLSDTPRSAWLARATGARWLCWLRALAARRCPLEQVLRNAAMQVLHGRRGSHANNPGVLERLAGRQPLTRVHSEHTVNEVLCQVGHTRPWLGWGEQKKTKWKAEKDFSQQMDRVYVWYTVLCSGLGHGKRYAVELKWLKK